MLKIKPIKAKKAYQDALHTIELLLKQNLIRIMVID